MPDALASIAKKISSLHVTAVALIALGTLTCAGVKNVRDYATSEVQKDHAEQVQIQADVQALKDQAREMNRRVEALVIGQCLDRDARSLALMQLSNDCKQLLAK